MCVFFHESVFFWIPAVSHLVWAWFGLLNEVQFKILLYVQLYAFFSTIFIFFDFVGVCVTLSAVAVEHSQHSVEVFLYLIYSCGFS